MTPNVMCHQPAQPIKKTWLLSGTLGRYSKVVTPDCKPAVPGSNPAISPAYSGPPILGWPAIWDGTPR